MAPARARTARASWGRWAAFDAIVATIRHLDDDETSLVESVRN